MTAAGIQLTTLWRNVPVGPLSEVLDVVGPSSPFTADRAADSDFVA